MEELVIDISAAGVVNALHTDKFPLSFLGPMHIARASHIEFGEGDQAFYVVLTKEVSEVSDLVGQPIFEATKFVGYDEARAFEVDWIQRCKKAGVDPLSKAGIAIAASVRVDHAFV